MKGIKILFFIWLTSLNFLAFGNPHTEVDEKIKDKVLNKICALKEVKTFFKTTPKSYKPVAVFWGEPNEKERFYWVKVGISNLDILRSRYNFYIDKKTYEIYYLDTMCNSYPDYITLKQWRCWRSTKAFNGMHVFKNGKPIIDN